MASIRQSQARHFSAPPARNHVHLQSNSKKANHSILSSHQILCYGIYPSPQISFLYKTKSVFSGTNQVRTKDTAMNLIFMHNHKLLHLTFKQRTDVKPCSPLNGFVSKPWKVNVNFTELLCVHMLFQNICAQMILGKVIVNAEILNIYFYTPQLTHFIKFLQRFRWNPSRL